MFAKHRELANELGFQEIMPNILEHEVLFRRSLGLFSDIVAKEMYRLQDLSDNNLVLRPEGTCGVLRFLLHRHDLLRPIARRPQKFHYSGPMFRYERPQSGRLRQFYQLGIERLGGDAHPLHDFEVIDLGLRFLHAVLPGHEFVVEVNTLGTREELRAY